MEDDKNNQEDVNYRYDEDAEGHENQLEFDRDYATYDALQKKGLIGITTRYGHSCTLSRRCDFVLLERKTRSLSTFSLPQAADKVKLRSYQLLKSTKFEVA